MYAKVIALLAVVFGTWGRVKYILQGNKIRRRNSSKDVSGGFYILTFIGYTLMLLHCINIRDWVGIVFWSVGWVTSSYCMVCVYVFWRVPFPKFLKVALREIFVDTFNTFRSFKGGK